MKKIYLALHTLLALLALNVTFTACSEDEPFSTATADDEPRILDPIFPDRVGGELPVVATLDRTGNLTMTLTVTPADYTDVSWLIDGEEVQTGKSLDIALKAGTYHFKVVASTQAGKSTSREGIVQVNPLADDPWATTLSFERIIAPGAEACLYGDHLDQVRSLVIGGQTITGLTYDADEACLTYEVPAALADGTHRVILVDEGGNEFGGNQVTVTRNALIVSGADRTTAGREWVMTGINLDKVASLTFGGTTVSEFVRRSATEIVLTCPDLADGEYQLTGKMQDGGAVQFYANGGTVNELTSIVSSSVVLFQGHHYVSWDLEDGNPNKTFNLIGKEVFASIKAGATLSVYYAVAPEAEYHQLQTTTGWWSQLPGTSTVEFSEDGVVDVLLTQEALDLIQAQDGFLCVGHGYYVELITVQ